MFRHLFFSSQETYYEIKNNAECNVISNNECWRMSSKVKKKVEESNVGFSRRILILQWINHVNNEG